MANYLRVTGCMTMTRCPNTSCNSRIHFYEQLSINCKHFANKYLAKGKLLANWISLCHFNCHCDSPVYGLVASSFRGDKILHTVSKYLSGVPVRRAEPLPISKSYWYLMRVLPISMKYGESQQPHPSMAIPSSFESSVSLERNSLTLVSRSCIPVSCLRLTSLVVVPLLIRVRHFLDEITITLAAVAFITLFHATARPSG